MFSYVLLSYLLEFLPSQIVSLQSSTDYNVPVPPNHLHQPYCLAPCYWELITTHTLPYINSILGQPAFFLDSWHLNMGPISCAKMSVRNHHSSLCINPEKHSSHLLCGGSLKSRKNPLLPQPLWSPDLSLQLTFLEVSLKQHWFELVWKMQETLHICSI